MKITFVGPLVSRFVKNDLAELRKVHEVRAFDGNIGRGWKAMIRLVLLNLRLCWSLVSTDAILYWFADYYSGIPTYVAKLLGRKVFIIAGGFDIWYLPELGIGAKNRPLRWWAVKTGFKYADLILPVSNYAMEMLDTNVPVHGPAVVAYSAVEQDLFQCKGEMKKQLALTVTQVDTVPEYIRKGIDRFIKAAPTLPDIKFQIVGIRGAAESQARIDAIGLENVEIIPYPITSEQLRVYYCEASVYCQLSLDETFGLSIAEAMNCGCVPVVSEPPVFREVIGDCGSIVHRDNPREITEGIRRHINAEEEERQSCRQQASKFHLTVRAAHLLSLLQ